MASDPEAKKQMENLLLAAVDEQVAIKEKIAEMALKIASGQDQVTSMQRNGKGPPRNQQTSQETQDGRQVRGDGVYSEDAELVTGLDVSGREARWLRLL
jgi:hypothetical protein